MKRLNRTRLFVGLLIAFVVGIAFLASRHEGGDQSPPVRPGDTSPEGGRALALVLEKLGYTVQTQDAPLTQMPSDARLWLLLDSGATFSDKEADLLLAWVKHGGTLLWVPTSESYSPLGGSTPHPGTDALRRRLGVSTDGQPNFDANGLPRMTPLRLDAVSRYGTGVKAASSSGASASVSGFNPRDDGGIPRGALRLAGAPGGSILRLDEGRGHIFVFPDAWGLCNFGLSQPQNATLVANLIRADSVGNSGGVAYFDARHHDNTLAPPAPDDWPARLRQKPVVFALWQLFFAGLGTLALVGRRLGAPVALPSSAPVTRASGFARAMGGLLLKAARPKAAAQIIGESFRARLARRIGLSPRDSDDILAGRAAEISGLDRDLLSRALMNSRAPATDEVSALRDAQQMERILDKLG